MRDATETYYDFNHMKKVKSVNMAQNEENYHDSEDWDDCLVDSGSTANINNSPRGLTKL